MTCRRLIPEGEARPRHLGLHVGNGVFFTRHPDGHVSICVHADGTGVGPATHEIELTSQQWIEAVADLDEVDGSRGADAPALTPTVGDAPSDAKTTEQLEEEAAARAAAGSADAGDGVDPTEGGGNS